MNKLNMSLLVLVPVGLNLEQTVSYVHTLTIVATYRVLTVSVHRSSTSLFSLGTFVRQLALHFVGIRRNSFRNRVHGLVHRLLGSAQRPLDCVLQVGCVGVFADLISRGIGVLRFEILNSAAGHFFGSTRRLVGLDRVWFM